MAKLKWMIKQLLPLTYRTRYEENGKKYYSVWNMWFGRSYNIDEIEIAK
jgi:hypothetical protein